MAPVVHGKTKTMPDGPGVASVTMKSMTMDLRPPVKEKVEKSALTAGDLTLSKRLDFVTTRIANVDANERKKTASLLAAGSVMGILAFSFVFITGFMQVHYSKKFDSGWPYFPSSVSEMGHDKTQASGKCFFGFMFLAALFIFQSWYPWELKNVYCGDDDGVGGVSFTMLRQLLPGPGIMIVAGVTSTPMAMATLLDWICIMIHMTGAFMAFMGYLFIEGHALGLMFRKSKTTWSSCARDTPEHRARKKCWICLNVFWWLFLGLEVVYSGIPMIPGSEKWFCCNDDWKDDPHTYASTIDALNNSAYGFVLLVKVVMYFAEVGAGIALLASHLVIWYHCKERNVDLDEHWLDSLDDTHGNKVVASLPSLSQSM